MTFIKNLKEISTETTTTNGDLAYTTTLSYNLDMFGASTASLEYLSDLFPKALNEDKITAIKNLLFLRDIKYGHGRRASFRLLLNQLADTYPKDVIALLPYIVELGRWDDILELALHKEVSSNVIQFIQEQLSKDVISDKPSLLGKWLPTESSKNPKVKHISRVLAKSLFEGDYKKYRKTLVELRRKIKIVETNLTNRDYSFNYENLPGKALLKYIDAFERNDEFRFNDYLKSLEDPKNLAKIGLKADKLYPHEIVHKVNNDNRYHKVIANTLWKSLPKEEAKHKIIVVRDGSGSMTSTIGNSSVSMLDVATALSIYAGERLSGPFKGKFITFSTNPKLVKFDVNAPLSQKVNLINSYDEISNTNIERTYNLLFNAMKKSKQEDRPDIVLILSDLQFDRMADDGDVSTYEALKRKFENAGLEMPKMVFWNLDVSGTPTFTTRKDGALFVSGFSKNLFNLLANDETISENLKQLDGMDLMMQALSRYTFVDELIK